MDYFDWGLTGGVDPTTLGYGPGWGSGEEQNPAVQQAQSGINLFKQTFKNLLGRDPTAQELQGYSQQALSGAVNAPGDLGYSDQSNLANNYIQGAFGPQLAQHQQQLQQDQLGKTQQTIQDLIQKQTAATASDLTNPNSSTYQSFSGNMNNLGITPSSGAFQAGLGGVLGQNAAQSINSALGAVSLPTIAGIQGSNQIPYQFAQSNSNLGHLNDLSDFGMQADLARQLSGGGGSNMLGQIGGLLGGGGKAAGGVASLMQATWICTAMVNHGVMTKDEVKELHGHLFKSFWKRPFKFIGYFIFGKLLVGLAESVKTDWRAWKPCFYGSVIREPDSLKALDLYEEAFWDLFRVVKRRLRIKTLVIYDNPAGEEK